MVASQLGCYDENERHVISEGRAMPGKQISCLSTAQIQIPSSQLSPTAFTGLLFSEFPRCGQSTDVFKLNLVSLPSQQPSPTTTDSLSCNRTRQIWHDGQGIVCKWDLCTTDIEHMLCPSAQISSQSI